MIKPAVPLIAAICAACSHISAHDRVVLSSFKPLPGGAFEYSVQNAIPTKDDPRTGPVFEEAWLREWLSQNTMCGSGYSITDIQPVKSYDAPLGGSVYRVTYLGRCA